MYAVYASVCNVFHDSLNNDFSEIECSELGARRGFLGISEGGVAPERGSRPKVPRYQFKHALICISDVSSWQEEVPQEGNSRSILSHKPTTTRPRFLKSWSVKVPALKDLLDRPFDLGNVELMERATKDARFVNTNWSSTWGDAFRSLKPHGSSPERVLDLLWFLGESSDEKMQKMDLDDVTVEDLTASRSALREVIGKVELLVKKGEEIRWNWYQNAPWLGYLRRNAPWWLGSVDLPLLRAMDARASILMTRLEDEAEKENARCLQEVA